jgi:hypothetical protein
MAAPTKTSAGVVGSLPISQVTGLQTALDNSVNRANHTGSQAISTVTGLQAALDNKQTIGGLFGLGDPGTPIVISGGVLTITKSHHFVDTEGGAAADDLTSISGGQIGDILVLSTPSGSRDVTVKNGANIVCGADRVLSTASKRIMLIKTASTVWTMLSFADN